MTLSATPLRAPTMLAALCLGAALFSAACTSPGTPAGPSATAQLQPTTGNTARGTATFEQRGDKVLLVAQVDGLKPGQEHGFHLHEKGDCSSGDGLSTGGHFNPNAKPHGPQGGEHHAGDLPALKADASGHAELRAELHGVTVAAGPTSVAGRGLIVHLGADDYTTQPTGNSGARIACGVVKPN